MDIQTQEFLKRILSAMVGDAWIPEEKIGENKEYKWRASSANHEPVLVSNKSGKIVAGAGKAASTQSEDEPTYYKVDVIPTGKHKGKKGFKYYDDEGNAQYIPETPLNKKHIKAEYEKPPTPSSPPTTPKSGEEPVYYKVDVIPEGKYKGKKGFKYYDENGRAQYFPENALNRKHIKAEYEKPQGESPISGKEEKAIPTKSTPPKSSVKITADNRPPHSSTTPEHEEFWNIYAEGFNKAITDKKVSDESVAFLYSTLAQRQRTEMFTLTETRDSCIQRFGSTGAIWEIRVPNLMHYSNAMGTVLHELGHFIDCSYDDFESDFYSKKNLENTVRELNKQPVPTELKEEILKAHRMRFNALADIEREWDKKVFEAKKRARDAAGTPEVKKLEEEYEQMKQLAQEKYHIADMNYWGGHGGWNAVSDICDALTKGRFKWDYGVFGHGPSYFASAENRNAEIWADYCNLAVLHPETLKTVEKYYPTLIQACRNMAKEMEEKWRREHD